MALRKPIVLVDGKLQQISSSDTLDARVIETEGVTLENEESSAAVTKGMAVYLSSAGKCKKAKADASGTMEVFGLVADDSITAGNSGLVQTAGQLQVADWTDVADGATLTAGAQYYASAAVAGKITSTPPTAGFIKPVGRAITTTTMQILIGQSIQL